MKRKLFLIIMMLFELVKAQNNNTMLKFIRIERAELRSKFKANDKKEKANQQTVANNSHKVTSN